MTRGGGFSRRDVRVSLPPVTTQRIPHQQRAATSVLLLAALLCPAAVRAQDATAETAPEAAATETAPPGTPETAVPETTAPVEPEPEAPIPPAPARPRFVAAAPVDDERPPIMGGEEEEAPDPTEGRTFEMFWSASGLLATGLSPSLSSRVDFGFALEPRWLLGVQLGVSYTQSTFRGPPDTVSVSTTVGPGLFIQHYFETPRTGAVMPTLRIAVNLQYVENSTTSGPSRTASILLGASGAVSGGATWLPEPWLGVRIIGGATASVTATAEGTPEQVNASIGVFAEAGVVIRL